MRTFLECIPCFFEQALRAGRLATRDETKIKKILDEVGLMLKDISLDSTPPEIGRLIYQKVHEISGNNDPYKEIKIQNTETALKLYPTLKDKLRQSGDSLMTAIRIAIAGNIIDFGARENFDIESELNDIMTKEFAICDYDSFRTLLSQTGRILYIGDNAGETVFDRILIEQMAKPTTYIVRESPVINDATREDAVRAGIDKVAEIISSGTNAPGAILETCNQDFLRLLSQSGLTISKGQGNYEALSGESYPIFFMLMAKCPRIAEDIGIHLNDIILKGINI